MQVFIILSVMIVSMTTVREQAANGATCFFSALLLLCSYGVLFTSIHHQFYKTLSPAYNEEMKAQVGKDTLFSP